MALAYEAVGVGIEEMTVTQNYETTSVKDVLGTTVTKATKGNKTVTVTPITINPSSVFAKWVDTAFERGYELSDLELDFLFVKTYKKVGAAEVDAKPVAWRQKAVVVPDEWAPGNQALQASITLNLIGEATYGTVDFEAIGDKFTAEVSEPTPATTFYETGDASRSDFIMYYEYTTT